MRKLLTWIALAAIAFVAPGVRAADSFLDPEDAFQVTARVDEAAARVLFEIVVAPGYHLYADSLKLDVAGGPVGTGPLQRPAGVVRYDEALKRPREQYAGTVTVAAPLHGRPGRFDALLTSQGCADQGLCYPPMTTRVSLELARPLDPPPPARDSTAGVATSAAAGAAIDADADRIEATLARGDLLSIALLFAGLGALLSLTPCVLPMVPILSALIVGQGVQVGRARGLALSASYALGMAVVYTSMGIAAGLAGEGLAGALQQPWVLMTFACLLVVLALSMFDVYTLQMPGAIQSRLQQVTSRIPGGQLASVFVSGGASSLIVGPCVAAPLAGALVYIGRTHDVVIGGVALFSMSVGMSLPLLLCGISAGSLLPRAGRWMNEVKRFFGVLLIAVAIWMASPVLPAAGAMIAWGTLAVVCAVWLGVLDPVPAGGGGGARLAKGAGAVLAVLGFAQLAGAMGGGSDPLQPLAPFGVRAAVGGGASAPAPASAPVFRRISAGEVDRVIGNAGRPVLVDFYADWCVSCKEMERSSFADPSVARELERFERLQVDVTANGDAERALMKRFQLFGPPAIVFFDTQGAALPAAKLVGYVAPDRLAPHLRRIQ